MWSTYIYIKLFTVLQARISDKILEDKRSSASGDRVLGERDLSLLSDGFETAEHSWIHSA